MSKVTIMPAVEFDAELDGRRAKYELSCASCTGTKGEVPDVEMLDPAATAKCGACGVSVKLKTAIEQAVSDG